MSSVVHLFENRINRKSSGYATDTNNCLTFVRVSTKRFFFHIAYKGLQYHGWQRQHSAVGVQAVLEDVFTKVLKKPIIIKGCGRTDARVHAAQYFFHTDLEEYYDFDLLSRLNRNLPADIALFDIIPVHAEAHARFDAVQRTYDYFLHRTKDPFLTGNSAYYPDLDLDLRQMRAAVDLLTRYEDYYAFCKSPNKYEHTICRVDRSLMWANSDESRLRFQFRANRFLTGMIRIIVGRLLEVGTGLMSVESFERHLREKETPTNIAGAYPQGLYLSKIVYPYLDLPLRTEAPLVFQGETPGYWREILDN